MEDAIINISVVAWCKRQNYIELLTVWNTTVQLHGILADLFVIIANYKNIASVYDKAEPLMSKEAIDSSLNELEKKGYIKIWKKKELFNCLFT